jgi:hypothetical protein
MSNVRTSKKWLSIVDRNDGTAQAIIMAIAQDKGKLYSKEGLKVTVNGYTYTLKNAPPRHLK